MSPFSFQTALHWAAKHGNENVVKLIAGTYKANANVQTVCIIFLSFFEDLCMAPRITWNASIINNCLVLPPLNAFYIPWAANMGMMVLWGRFYWQIDNGMMGPFCDAAIKTPNIQMTEWSKYILFLYFYHNLRKVEKTCIKNGNG